MDINWQELLTKVIDQVLNWAPNIVWALGIFILGKIVVKIIRAVLIGAMKRSKVDETLRIFVANIANAGMMAFVVIAALVRIAKMIVQKMIARKKSGRRRTKNRRNRTKSAR